MPLAPLAAAPAGDTAFFSAPHEGSAQVSTADLKAAVEDPQVRSFYERLGWQQVWTAERAEALEQALKGAGAHGLSPSVFAPAAERLQNPAEREAALTAAALSYADALAHGKVQPEELFEVYTIDRSTVDVAGGLAQALQDGGLERWLDGLAPQDEEYRALSRAYQRALEGSLQGGERQISSGDLIRVGDMDPRVPRIAAALAEGGYLSDTGDRSSGTYTEEIAAATERMQERAGLAVDGVIGPNTLQVLNRDAADRARTLAVNLERRRWLPREAPATRIDVNTAAAQLDYYRNGRHEDHRRVIVGQPGWETPQLQSPLFRLVANPTWTVPRSIERQEIAPKGPAYLRRNNMKRQNGWIVQQPGPDNALGLVKFDMKNGQAIYLHDTSARSLFENNARHLSHGCVRVDDAPGFARLIAEDLGVKDTFLDARETGEETFVDLPSETPVRLLYHTAYAGDGGKVAFRPDNYGWDEDVAEALGLGRRDRGDRRAIYAHLESLGP